VSTHVNASFLLNFGIKPFIIGVAVSSHCTQARVQLGASMGYFVMKLDQHMFWHCPNLAVASQNALSFVDDLSSETWNR